VTNRSRVSISTAAYGIGTENETLGTSATMTDVVASTTTTSFNQQASYAQLFVAIRERLVASGIAERLRVDQPHAQELRGARLELAARLSSQVTVTFGSRFEHNQQNVRPDVLGVGLVR
jgi:hypothetical protein